MSLSKREIYERTAPATLLIVTIHDNGTPEGVGSGVIIGADGLAVTNYHVIESALKNPSAIHCFLPPPESEASADNLMAFLKRYGKAPIRCRIGKLAPEIDIAFLHLEATTSREYPWIPLGDSSKVRPGDDVVCIGNPHGLVWTMTDGSVSARRENAIQISAPISPGNSGGPLVNIHGELIGVNSFVHATGQNLNFARPARLIHGLLGDEGSDAAWVAVPTKTPPRGVDSYTLHRQTVGGATRRRLNVTFSATHLGGVELIEGAQVAVILDASFRTYAAWWRSGKIIDALAKMVRGAVSVGLPGIHVWLACTRQKPSEYVGLLRTEGEASALSGRFPDASMARQRMGMDRNLVPALEEVQAKLCREGANVVVGAFGEGAFDDAEAADEWFGTASRRWNSEEEPYRLGVAIRTLTEAGGFSTPGELGAYTRTMVSEISGFSASLGDAIASALACVGTGGTFAVEGEAQRVRDGVTRRSVSGRQFSRFDVVPAQISVEVESPALASIQHFELSFEGLDGSRFVARFPCG